MVSYDDSPYQVSHDIETLPIIKADGQSTFLCTEMDPVSINPRSFTKTTSSYLTILCYFIIALCGILSISQFNRHKYSY